MHGKSQPTHCPVVWRYDSHASGGAAFLVSILSHPAGLTEECCVCGWTVPPANGRTRCMVPAPGSFPSALEPQWSVPTLSDTRRHRMSLTCKGCKHLGLPPSSKDKLLEPHIRSPTARDCNAEKPHRGACIDGTPCAQPSWGPTIQQAPPDFLADGFHTHRCWVRAGY